MDDHLPNSLVKQMGYDEATTLQRMQDLGCGLSHS
jgi:hypothetical protein